jgi:hypothetical protein
MESEPVKRDEMRAAARERWRERERRERERRRALEARALVGFLASRWRVKSGNPP